MKKIIVVGIVILLVEVQAFACAAVTKKGTLCKRAPVPGSQYCWQHGGRSSAQQSGESQSGLGSLNSATNSVKQPLNIKTFMGIKFGVPVSKVGGNSIKGCKDSRDVQLSRPFRDFKRAKVVFDSASGLSKTIISECKLSARKSREDALNEFDVIKAIIEKKYSIKITRPMPVYYSAGTSNRLSSMGLGYGGGDSAIRRESYKDENSLIEIACMMYEAPNKALKGPGVSDTLQAYKIIIEVTSRSFGKTQDKAKLDRNSDLEGIDAL